MNEEKKSRKVLNYIVGAFVVALVIVGLISIVMFLSGKISTSKKNSQSKKLETYESFITPVIMNDPDTFDDVSKANQNQLIAISIWAILDENSDPDKYEYTDSGMMLPQKDVEKKFTALFGPDVKIQHTTVDGGGVEFKYSEKKSCYIIPITGITPIYTPVVTEATEKGNSITLTVGYLAGEDWAQDENGKMVAPEPAKYVKITLRKTGDDSFYVAAVQAM